MEPRLKPVIYGMDKKLYPYKSMGRNGSPGVWLYFKTTVEVG